MGAKIINGTLLTMPDYNSGCSCLEGRGLLKRFYDIFVKIAKQFWYFKIAESTIIASCFCYRIYFIFWKRYINCWHLKNREMTKRNKNGCRLFVLLQNPQNTHEIKKVRNQRNSIRHLRLWRHCYIHPSWNLFIHTKLI